MYHNDLFALIMSLSSLFTQKEQDAYFLTLGITCTLALSIMMTRHFNLCSSSVSRKLLHICIYYAVYWLLVAMAPTFLICWTFFPDTTNAKYLALSSMSIVSSLCHSTFIVHCCFLVGR